MAFALAAGAAVPIVPLSAYNASQGDTVLISSQAGINLWIGMVTILNTALARVLCCSLCYSSVACFIKIFAIGDVDRDTSGLWQGVRVCG